jgi:hypothetical protein
LIYVTFSIRVELWYSLGLFLVNFFIYDYFDGFLGFSKVDLILVAQLSHVVACSVPHEMLSEIFVTAGTDLFDLVLKSYGVVVLGRIHIQKRVQVYVLLGLLQPIITESEVSLRE